MKSMENNEERVMVLGPSELLQAIRRRKGDRWSLSCRAAEKLIMRRKAAVTEVKLVIVGEKTESVKSSNEWSMRAREELSFLHEQLAHARAMVMDVIHKSDKKNPHSCLGCSFSHDIYDTEACLFEINGDCGPFNGYAHYKRSESVVAEANPVIVEEKTEAAKSSDGSDCPRCHGRGIFYDADKDSWFRCDHTRLPNGAWF
jgi:hypothetical protein